MRFALLAVALSVPSLQSGCHLPGQCASTGFHWSLSLDKPAVVAANAVVANGTTTSTGVMPLSAGPGGVAGQTMAFAPFAAMAPGATGPCLPPPPTTGVLAMQSSLTCTLEDVCRRLAQIERRLGEQIPPPRPMPSAQP